MSKAQDRLMIQRIERALVKVSMLIEDGQVQLAPIFERLEEELEMRLADDPRARARAILKQKAAA